MIYEAINKINSLHKKSERYHLISQIIFCGSGLLLAMGLAFEPLMFVFYLGAVIFGCLIVIIFIKPEEKRARNALRSEYKDVFLPGILSENFDDAKYEYWVGLTEMEVRETSLYKLGNRFESEDLLRGTYKNVTFKQSDVHIWQHEESEDKKNQQDIYYFGGRIIMFDTQWEYNSSVRVISKKRNASKVDKRLGFDEEHRVETESMAFNECFKVYARTGHDAFYILTPDVMEQIISIYNQYCKNADGSYRDMSFHFRDNKFYFAIETGNQAFEPGKFPICYPDEKKKLEKDIQIIKELIDCFAFMKNNYDFTIED